MIIPESGGFAAIAIAAFLLGFPALFAIINPIGAALIFDSIAKNFSPADRTKVSGLVGFYSLLVMFGALWCGASVLSFFGVSLEALRIAGGLVVTISAWGLLTSDDHRDDRESRDARPDSRLDPSQMAFFPLTLPFTTGPGTIAVAITLGAARPEGSAGLLPFFLGASLAAALNAAIVWLAYRFSDRVTNWMGPAARMAVARLSAFLLVCIGTQILISAIGDLVLKWRSL